MENRGSEGQQGTRIVLPYGDTLHYRGCGCPQPHQSGHRAADMVDKLVWESYEGYRTYWTPLRPLTVAYMLPHHNITGGMKCLCEHIRLLRSRGHKTIAIHRSDTADRAMPPWTDIEADEDVVCKLNQSIHEVYPVKNIDCVVVGIFHQVAELLLGVPAPILYWEQGHEWIFGDPVRHQIQHNYAKQDQLFHMVMHLPVAIAAVSKAVEAILNQEFGRRALVIPNSIDCQRFFPGPHAFVQPTMVIGLPSTQGETDDLDGRMSVLIVGNPALPLKGFDVAIEVLMLANQQLPITVSWICQTAPNANMLSSLRSYRIPVKLYVNPPQVQIPMLYRGHDAFLFTSRYEAWGMPVLEAMASGLAVVSTRCLGVDSFAVHDYNVLLAAKQDVRSLARQLIAILRDNSLRKRLGDAARETALKFSPDAIATELERVLYSISNVSYYLYHGQEMCKEDIRRACTWAAIACARNGQNLQQSRG
eukprot:jgi/Botrbrau1/23222/Bobra.0041s0064.1